MTNKYGGINDMPKEWYESPISRSIYNLWYGMLRRCYDEEQQQRKRGRAYADCSVCSDIKGFKCGAQRQFEADKSDDLIKRSDVYKAVDDWLEGKVPNLNIKDIPSADERSRR